MEREIVERIGGAEVKLCGDSGRDPRSVNGN